MARFFEQESLHSMITRRRPYGGLISWNFVLNNFAHNPTGGNWRQMLLESRHRGEPTSSVHG